MKANMARLSVSSRYEAAWEDQAREIMRISKELPWYIGDNCIKCSGKFSELQPLFEKLLVKDFGPLRPEIILSVGRDDMRPGSL